MSAKIHMTDSTSTSSMSQFTPPPKERGRSLLLGSKPKYKTAKKALEDGTTQVPLPEIDEDAEKTSAGADAASVKLKAEPEPEPEPEVPALSLDAQLKMKLQAEIEEARLRKEAEDAQLAKDMDALGVDRDSSGPTAMPQQRRVSVRDHMRQSCLIQDINPDEMTEDEMAEKIGSTFHSLWGAVGIKEQFTKKIDKVKEKVKDVKGKVHIEIHPSEVLERTTSGFARRKYRGIHHDLEKSETGGDDVPSSSAPPLPSGGPRRRGGMKQATSESFGSNPFHTLHLSTDEVDFFYGAFCEIGGAGPEDVAPTTITLQQMVDWLYKVEYRFRTKDLKGNDPILWQNIETVHYFDKKEGSAKQATLNDTSLLQGSEARERQPWEVEGDDFSSNNPKAAATNNISMSAKDVPPSESAEEAKIRQKMEFDKKMKEKLEAYESENNISMTFLDFVLSMWNFLTADETIMLKNLFEYIEVGMLGSKDPCGVIPLKYVETLGRIWYPEKKILGLKKSNTKRKKNKLAVMVKAMTELAHVNKQTGEKFVLLGNFVGWCLKNRSFSSHVHRIQMDMYACLMGASFWKRHSKMRLQKFGIANLNMCLKGQSVNPKTGLMLSKEQSLQSGKTVSTKREKAKPAEGAAQGTEEEGAEKDEAAVEEEEEDPDSLKSAQELETERVDEAKSNILKKKSRIRLGKTILMIEDKMSKGERLNGDESWLYAKMVAQTKTANKLYMRQSVIGVQNQSVTRKMGFRRALKEEDEEDIEEEEEELAEEDKEMVSQMDMAAAEKEKAEKAAKAANAAAKAAAKAEAKAEAIAKEEE